MGAKGSVPERLVLCATRGVPQEVEFLLLHEDGGCRVCSEVRVDGCLPRRGPALHTPLPDELARRWMESQAAKLTRKAAKFRPLTVEEELRRQIVSVLPADPTLLIAQMFDEEIARHG